MIDPIVDELHRQRRAQSEAFGNDLSAWLKDLRDRAKGSREPHRTTPLKPRKLPVDTVASTAAEAK
jgi:hypothetical protein